MNKKSIDYQLIVNYLSQGVTFNQISQELNIPSSTLKTWCNDLGIYSRKITQRKDSKICGRCKHSKDKNEFYLQKDNTYSSYCKVCYAEVVKLNKQIFKIKCLEYKGKQCEVCGYNKCIGALHFHHIDPFKKNFSISEFRYREFNDTIKSELDKCQVLCANCHAEQHYYLTT